LNAPIGFAFFEGDLLDDPSLPNRTAVQLGTRIGVRWAVTARMRFGLEWQHRELVGKRRYDSAAALWASLSPSRNTALVLEAKEQRILEQDPQRSIGAEWRWYF